MHDLEKKFESNRRFGVRSLVVKKIRNFINQTFERLRGPDLDLARFEELERKKTFTNKGRMP